MAFGGGGAAALAPALGREPAVAFEDEDGFPSALATAAGGQAAALGAMSRETVFLPAGLVDGVAWAFIVADKFCTGAPPGKCPNPPAPCCEQGFSS